MDYDDLIKEYGKYFLSQYRRDNNITNLLIPEIISDMKDYLTYLDQNDENIIRLFNDYSFEKISKIYIDSVLENAE
ncbi:MAG: hypothetical protein UR73_C0001G0002 [candidate division WS6 bacterium GW2011_GWF1_35_23]|uniref:Uncharacterized protein n=1 Tax=candidate division WS6 bacterium GW2011_GWF1_35_23 TaxID=1619097 RepID=A0A0G0FFS4_9BACT|nr:MAG: hypothetical protein UR73_C0001G0002 [candidate division WS6 bacterium GW2011_GWF1_35_23]